MAESRFTQYDKHVQYNQRVQRKQLKHRRQHGFTLIELLTAITILAILVILAWINAPKLIGKSRDARRKSDLQAYRVAFEHYYEDYKCYPEESILQDCESTSTALKPYLQKILCDPVTKQPYELEKSGCTWYKIYTKLNDETDPDIAGVGCTSGCGPGDSKVYNYGVSSPNVAIGDTAAATGECVGLECPTCLGGCVINETGCCPDLRVCNGTGDRCLPP